MRKRGPLSLAAALLLLTLVSAIALRALPSEGGPPVRVSTGAAARLGVHDLTSFEAPPYRVPPSAVRAPRSSGAAVVRLRMPSVGIDAPIVTGYLTADGAEMIAPNSPRNVAWYEYSPRPGQGGNAVFSGHVDWVGIGPAVFWGLRSVTLGDVIKVDLADGTSLSYRVETNEMYAAGTGPWGELFSPYAGDDVITLYTCDGPFSQGDYADRRVVRAARIF